ncbi:GntR family transcriptional regulator [Pseudomonas sp. DTU12.3]|uniref:aminotransferase-like domain-containing protein n=1 Tax=Pseudomonas sp. DTU12.3 TaxID=2073078 RepID=UPI0010136F29|nr:PLP-dependent aminotransferase family protein [Pseudomonas sp. DTU12.3]QAX85116.1 GntR family transcriptional regulator [Pseudomonas sp. DTU12.3]
MTRANTPTKPQRENDFAYQAVYRYLTVLINASVSGCAVRLPSLRQLAERLNVSISTIQYAYSLLEKEGRVYSVAKSGYYAQASALMVPSGNASDVLEAVYGNARRPGMCVLSADEPASLQSLDSPLLMLERELLRQYPRQPQLLAQPCGELELRTVLAARYTVSPVNCWHADDVYVGADLRSVLEILIAVLQLRGVTVLVESPCDWMILRLLEAAEVRVIELPLQADGQLDPQQLLTLLQSERVGLILLSSALSLPHGSLAPDANRQLIAHLLANHGTWVLENDCSSELADEPCVQRLRDWLDPDRLLVFSAFDRLIGVEAPYGFVLSRQWRTELQRHFLLRSFRLSATRQKALARLFTSGRIDQHLQVLRRLLKERRTQLNHLLRERLGDAVEIVEPQGGATLWLRSVRRVDMSEVFQHLLRQQIVIAPGELFSLNGHYPHHLRLSPISHSDLDLPDVVGRVADALRLAPGD